MIWIHVLNYILSYLTGSSRNPVILSSMAIGPKTLNTEENRITVDCNRWTIDRHSPSDYEQRQCGFRPNTGIGIVFVIASVPSSARPNFSSPKFGEAQ